MSEMQSDFPAGAAIVAGGSGGLGRAASEAFARLGCAVAILYRSRHEAAADVVKLLHSKGVEAEAWPVDLVDAAAARKAVEAAAARFGHLHTAIYAAGPTITIDYLSRIAPEEFARVLTADATACFNFIGAVLPSLRASGGALIGITTDQLERVELRGALSSVPKAAVDKMFEVVAKEEARHGVRAATVRAGWIDAGLGADALARKLPPDALKKLIDGIPLHRLGRPHEIGETVAFLASRRGGYVTGVSLAVNGGRHL